MDDSHDLVQNQNLSRQLAICIGVSGPIYDLLFCQEGWTWLPSASTPYELLGEYTIEYIVKTPYGVNALNRFQKHQVLFTEDKNWKGT